MVIERRIKETILHDRLSEHMSTLGFRLGSKRAEISPEFVSLIKRAISIHDRLPEHLRESYRKRFKDEYGKSMKDAIKVVDAYRQIIISGEP